MTFFQSFERFHGRIAAIETDTGRSIQYDELDHLINQRLNDFDSCASGRKLIFLEASNHIDSIVSYLAALRGGHPVHLVEDIADRKTALLVDLYGPNLLITKDGGMHATNHPLLDLHPALRLLLSTSGSTGTPKFVRLSGENLASNASAIKEYLNIDSNDRAYCHLKAFYSFGISVINSHLHAGACLLLTNAAISDARFLKDLNDFSATSLPGVPYTFEFLSNMGAKLDNFPSLRTITQAGGKLNQALVKKYSDDCVNSGKRFFVMYGQTEASPRISYLPPEKASEFPTSIGIAIPGGKLSIIDANGSLVSEPFVDGELVYEGPNVMMGYATSPAELSLGQGPCSLSTGDIAHRNQDGLFFITGRSSRFVKMFGLRLNLDQIQSDIQSKFCTAIVAGTDESIKVGLVGGKSGTSSEVFQHLTSSYKLPKTCFQVGEIDEIPLLPNGKYDYKGLLALELSRSKRTSVLDLIKQFILTTLELDDKNWGSVSELIEGTIPNLHISDSQPLDSITMDSLTFVSLSIEMEDLFGDALPQNWRTMSISDLDDILLKMHGES